MKYYTIGSFFISLSLILTFIVFYFSVLTRQIEKKIDLTNLEIIKFKESIKLNELEYSAHTNPIYLKRLEEIYLSNELNFSNETNIVSYKYLHKKIEDIFEVNLNY